MEFINLSAELLTFLFVAGCVAGFLDTLAGGGGLITLPALMLSGIPPLAALGTNKLQGTMGTATASFFMFRKKRVRWAEVKIPMLFAFIGSVLGSIAVQFIHTKALSFLIPVVLLVIAVYFLFSQNLSSSSPPKMAESVYTKTIIPAIGWYDGMFGPGTGSFFVFGGNTCRGLGIIDATVVAKTLNFATNIASLMVFILVGQLAWTVGLVMMGGQLIGAWIGSHFLLRIDPKYIRYLVVTMCTAMIIRYIASMQWFGG